MPNGTIPNPLAAPLTTLKQIGEQTNQAIQSLGIGMARSASQGVDALITGAPPIPGLPGAPAVAGLPTPQQLLPANLAQALGQIENVLIPPGMPRPSQAMRGVVPTPPAPTPAPPQPQPVTPAVTGRRRITEMRGY